MFSRAVRVGIEVEGLEDEADLLGADPGALVLRQRREVLAVEDDAAAGRPVEAGEQSEERALAAARGPVMARKPPGSRSNVISLRTVISRPPETYVRVSDSERRMDMQWPRPPCPGIISAKAAALAAALLALAGAPACRERPAASARPATGAPSASPVPAEAIRTARPPAPGDGAASTPTGDGRPVVLFVGTSLTAGLGVDPDEAYPALIQRKIDAAGLRYRVVNAGVSGETSAGARARIDWLLGQPVAVLVLETGANDGLRGQDPEATRANIQAILDAARARKPPPKLALVAMEALPNYGHDYRRRFRAIYPELAQAERRDPRPVPARRRRRRPEAQPARRHPPDRRGPRERSRDVWKALRPIL